MRRRRQLELILVLGDGSTLLVPAKWTDLEGHADAPPAGTLGSLQDLLAARRVLDRVLEAVVAHEAARILARVERATRAQLHPVAYAPGSPTSTSPHPRAGTAPACTN